jgi:hypothetical protein
LTAAPAEPALAERSTEVAQEGKKREPVPGTPNLYVIDEDGKVQIDWHTVETPAASKADCAVLPLAQLMLVIRDGIWRPAR